MIQLNYRILEAWRSTPLSRILRENLGFSALRLKELRTSQGSVLLDGQSVPLYCPPEGAKVLTICLPEDPPSQIPPVAGALQVLYEDDHLIILDKAAGMAVHPGRDTTGTPWGICSPGTMNPAASTTCSGRSTDWTGAPAGWCAWPSTPSPPNCWGSPWSAAGSKRNTWRCARGYQAAGGGASTPPSAAGRFRTGRQVRPDGKRAVTRYRALGGRHGRSLLHIRPEPDAPTRSGYIWPGWAIR